MSEPYKIYTLHDPDTMAVRYVGFTTKTLEKRLSAHIYSAKFRLSEKSHRTSWIKSLLMDCKTPPIMLVENVSPENWQERERFWIKHFRHTMGCDLVNSCDGGEGTPNPSHEVREKIRASKLGKPRSEETRAKMRACRLGKTHSAETRAKTSAALIGRVHSRISLEKLSASKSKPVINTSTGEVFKGGKVAALALGISYTTMKRWIRCGKFTHVTPVV